MLVLAYVLLVAFGLDPLFKATLPDAAGVLGVLVYVPMLVYHLAFEVLLRGQSPGKRLVGLTVVRLDGTPPTPMQFVLRWLLRWVDVTLSQGVVAAFAIAVTRHGQRLGDLAAGTTVVRRLPPIALVDIDYPTVGPGYVPQIPEAVRLSDADVRTLRAVLLKARSQPESEEARRLLRQAADLVLARVGPHLSWMTPEDLLARVVTDYTVLHDRYA